MRFGQRAGGLVFLRHAARQGVLRESGGDGYDFDESKNVF
jgi:hypothetical protein